MSDWNVSLSLIKNAISSEFIRHSYILESDAIKGKDKHSFEKIYYGKAETEDYIYSLELLSKALCNYHKQKPYILLDEYDTLLNEAYINGYWAESIEFMKAFMNSGFKNNIYLKKGILTGISEWLKKASLAI